MLGDKKKGYFANMLIVLLCSIIIMGNTVFADGSCELMQMASDGTDLLIYIKNLGTEGEFSGQVAMNEASISGSSLITDMHTIILLDNSLSITKENKAKIKAILDEYFQRKPEWEQVSLAVFGEDIVYLAERETDSDKLSDLIEGIEYKNRDSYLTDILYDEIEKLESESQYTRFIVATDGVDNKTIGYTKEELQRKLEIKNYPVYALGCVYKDNTSEIENLFAISRMTAGNSFLVDEYEEYEEIVDTFFENVYCVRMSVPEDCRDGSEKSILLIQNTSEGVNQFTGKAKMPFQIKAESEIASVPESETETIEEISVEEIEVVSEPAYESEIDYVSIGAFLLIIIAVVLLVVLQITRKKKTKKVPKESNKKNEIPVQPVILTEEPDDDGTVLMASVRYLLVLKDAKDSKKIFKYPILGKVVIGKSASKGAQVIINYDNSVSGTHCAISESAGRFFVEDLNSLNGTFLNGEKVTKRAECASGDVLKLGLLELIIDIVDEEF